VKSIGVLRLQKGFEVEQIFSSVNASNRILTAWRGNY